MSLLQLLNEGERSQDHDHVQGPSQMTHERIPEDVSGILGHLETVKESHIGTPAVAHHLHLTGKSVSITVVGAIHLVTEDIEIDHLDPLPHPEKTVMTLVHRAMLLRLAKYTVDKSKK